MMKIRGAGSLSDSDSDEGDRERFEEDVELTEPSERVLRMWLHEARKRSRRRTVRPRRRRSLGDVGQRGGARAKVPPRSLSARRRLRSSRDGSRRRARFGRHGAIVPSASFPRPTRTERVSSGAFPSSNRRRSGFFATGSSARGPATTTRGGKERALQR